MSQYSHYRKNKPKEPEINELKTRLEFPKVSQLSNFLIFFSFPTFDVYSSMSVWHTGNNLPQQKLTSQYPPTMHDTDNNFSHTLETLVRDYNMVQQYNAALFTQCLFAIYSGNKSCYEDISKLKFKLLAKDPVQEEAKTYREHREKKGVNDSDGWDDNNASTSTNHVRDNGWGDTNTSSKGARDNGWGDSNKSSWNDRSKDDSNSRGGFGGRREGRPDDWPCTKCDYKTNFGSRNECFKCKEPRGDSGSSFGGAQQRPRREPRPDDWACECGYKTNFGNRTECFKCHKPKDDSSNDSGFGGKRSSSGWDDEENDSKKQKTDNGGGENWDDEVPSTSAKSAETAEVVIEKKTEINPAMKDGEDWD